MNETKVIGQEIKENYSLYYGDCISIIKGIPDNSIGYSVFSPPFAELYYYSDSPNDMGNSKNYDVFFKHFEYLVIELQRVIKPGRSVSIHCIDIPAMKERDGYLGIKDFPGDIIRMFEDNGFIYHSKVTIWKDPLIEVTRTKALGLMYRQLCKDSSLCRVGLPDYLITMRKKGENKEPITHSEGLSDYEYFGKEAPTTYTDSIMKSMIKIYPGHEKYNHRVWQLYASPVWSDIRQTRTLQKTSARAEKDEKHICPLQLDTIGRCILLWSNPDDIILSPFAGIGSEIYQALLMDRRAIGIELKESYYKQMVLNAAEADKTKKQRYLF